MGQGSEGHGHQARLIGRIQVRTFRVAVPRNATSMSGSGPGATDPIVIFWACYHHFLHIAVPAEGGRMKISRRKLLQSAAVAAALPALSRPAAAQDAFPSHPIRLVVGFTPGTAADIAARTFAAGAEGVLGQKIVVENKSGAGSALAAEY